MADGGRSKTFKPVTRLIAPVRDIGAHGGRLLEGKIHFGYLVVHCFPVSPTILKGASKMPITSFLADVVSTGHKETRRDRVPA